MNRLTTIITLLLVACTILPLSAKKKTENLLPADIYGFEMNDGAWWTKYKEAFQITDEKSSTGEMSLKYSVKDISAFDTKNLAMQGGNIKKGMGLVSLEPGIYTVSVKVWISAEAAPIGFSTNLKKPFVAVPWKLKGIATEEWVEMTQEITVKEAVTASNFIVSVSINPKWGGAGTFYIDDIIITK